jgi:hypothetical protein
MQYYVVVHKASLTMPTTFTYDVPNRSLKASKSERAGRSGISHVFSRPIANRNLQLPNPRAILMRYRSPVGTLRYTGWLNVAGVTDTARFIDSFSSLRRSLGVG